MGECKFLCKIPKTKHGGVCGFCGCCPNMYDDKIVCPLKKVVREYEDRKGQKDLPSAAEIRRDKITYVPQVERPKHEPDYGKKN